MKQKRNKNCLKIFLTRIMKTCIANQAYRIRVCHIFVRALKFIKRFRIG